MYQTRAQSEGVSRGRTHIFVTRSARSFGVGYSQQIPGIVFTYVSFVPRGPNLPHMSVAVYHGTFYSVAGLHARLRDTYYNVMGISIIRETSGTLQHPWAKTHCCITQYGHLPTSIHPVTHPPTNPFTHYRSESTLPPSRLTKIKGKINGKETAI